MWHIPIVTGKALRLARPDLRGYDTSNMELPRYTPDRPARPLQETVTAQKRETNKKIGSKVLEQVPEDDDPAVLLEMKNEAQALITAGRNWRDFARCLRSDPELFFPGKGGSDKEAKAVCAKCPVIEQCLDHALERNEGHGTWGGMNAEERRALRRRTRQR